MATTVDRGPVSAAESEQYTLDQIEALLSSANSGAEAPKLLGAQGQEVALPESVVALLRQVEHQLVRQMVVTIVPRDRELTTQEVAELLGVSRPYLIRLLDQGVCLTRGPGLTGASASTISCTTRRVRRRTRAGAR